jgi:hypothetical protein
MFIGCITQMALSVPEERDGAAEQRLQVKNSQI